MVRVGAARRGAAWDGAAQDCAPRRAAPRRACMHAFSVFSPPAFFFGFFPVHAGANLPKI